MTRTWINAIYDRSYGDVQAVQYDPDETNPKGCWNAIDLNRIEKNTAYCAEYMLEKKIVRTPPSITVRENNYWTGDKIPTQTELSRIFNNVRLLVELSSANPAIADKLPTIYAATQVNYVYANQLEYALELMHNQPKLPSEYWNLTITNGIVTTIVRDNGTTETINASSALVAEDEIVTIAGVEYGEYAQYQHFTYWSGNANDIALLNNYQNQQTTFEMPYREVAFTANFETRIPRTLTLNNAYISVNDDPTATTGPTTGTYYAGDEVMIIANVATEGKAFYEWTGTQEALGNITGVTSEEDPSTAWLVMPDCDVTLTPHYINAGKHYVTVNNGSGSGWYNYKDYVSISADSRDHYRFTQWSGATNYLSDIYSPYQSFKMGDSSIIFTANYTYEPSYNDVQVIDGYISVNGQNVTQAQNLREGSQYTLIPIPPDDSQGLSYWQVEGYGSVLNDTFTVGDGNAIITAHYAPYKTLIISNVNNAGTITATRIVQSRTTEVSTSVLVGNDIFTNWTEGTTVISNSSSYRFTMPARDLTLTANYRALNQVTVTIDYGSHSEIISMRERSSKSITADSAPIGQHFAGWSSSGLYSILNANSATTSFTAGSGDGTITATYENDYNYHNLTINNGSGSGRVREGYGSSIYANTAPSGYEFDKWIINSGAGCSIDNIYANSSIFRMGTTDAEITATYKVKPNFTVTMIDADIWNGSNWVTSATLPRDSINTIKMHPAPTGEQFLQWVVYVNGEIDDGANDVYEPLAETSRLRSLSRDITIRATYYTPDPEILYTLSIKRKDGSIEQADYSAGTDVPIRASYPDQGYEFWRWEGDTSYIAGGVTNAESYVHMPAKNIQIEEKYQPEGYIPEYKIDMTNIYGECCYETTYEDPETHEITTTENWVSTYEHYHQEDIVKIRAVNIPNEYYFNAWTAYNHDSHADARSVISNISQANTTLTMPDYDLDIEPSIALKQTYQLRVNEGGTSGYYYKDARADVYFGLVDTNDVHYRFIRWTGTNISQIELYDGGMFNVLTPGNINTPQYIKMPGRTTELTPTYKALYRITLVNGIIDSTSTTNGYYEANTTLTITADAPSTGARFQYWSGDTDVLSNKYDPTPTVTTTTGATDLVAVYSDDSNRNSIGYTTTSLSSSNIVNNNDITVIAGEIEVGFILTDSKGHIYIVTNVDTTNNTSTIYRMTKITQGGNIYG